MILVRRHAMRRQLREDWLVLSAQRNYASNDRVAVTVRQLAERDDDILEVLAGIRTMLSRARHFPLANRLSDPGLLHHQHSSLNSLAVLWKVDVVRDDVRYAREVVDLVVRVAQPDVFATVDLESFGDLGGGVGWKGLAGDDGEGDALEDGARDGRVALLHLAGRLCVQQGKLTGMHMRHVALGTLRGKRGAGKRARLPTHVLNNIRTHAHLDCLPYVFHRVGHD